MAVLTNSIWTDIAVAVVPLLLLVILFFKERYKYWEKLGVPFVKPSVPFGNCKDNFIGKVNIFEIYNRIYDELKGERFGGFFEYHSPNLLIRDPDLSYRVLVKDFAHFHDRALFPADPKNDPLSYTLTSMEGQDWRVLRYKLSPTFTSGKLKGMLEQMYNCGENLLAELDKVSRNKEEIEGRDILGIFTIDVIASCAFGLQFKMDSPEGQRFKKMVTNAFPQSRFASFLMLIMFLYTRFATAVGIRVFSKEVTEYFINLSKETVKHRKQLKIKRNDFLQLLLELKEKEDNMVSTKEDETVEDDPIINQLNNSSVYSKDFQNRKVMTDECLAASSFLFLAAGAEVSTVMSFTLFCVAKHLEIQKKLQQEVDDVLAKHGKLSYQALKDMVYLDQVLQESMRLYPPGTFLSRKCTIPYRIPDSDVVLEPGTRITIPVWAIHHDSKYYPNPHKFDPDRFIDNNYKPSPTYMPFGDGPRICIAMRFAILEMKVCISRIMSQYTISLSDKMKDELEFMPNGIALRVKGGILLTVSRRKESTL